MKLILLTYFILIPSILFSQSSYLSKKYNLKPKYQNISNMSIDSTARLVKTLSTNYCNKKLKSKDTLYFYSKNPQYSLYQDSLDLYYLMHVEPENKSREAKFQKEEAPKMNSSSFQCKNIQEEIKIYETNLKEHLKYEYRIKVPASYESFDLLLSVEEGDTAFCSYYNNHRIKVFNCMYGEIVFQLAYHKTILPESFEAVKMAFSDWMPRKTHYKKPTIPIKPSTNQKLIWEKQTGLPYQVAVDLGISSNPRRLSHILYKLDKVKGFKLKDLQNDLYDLLEKDVTQEEEFEVTCDTCTLEFYDFSVEDKDHIKIYYENKEVFNDIIIAKKQNIIIVPKRKQSVMYIIAVSEGETGTCTAQINFADNEFMLSLDKGKVCKIIVKK